VINIANKKNEAPEGAKKEDKSKETSKEDNQNQQDQEFDFKKGYEELQSTISEQGETIKQHNEAIMAASIISNTIANNPTLLAEFDKTLKQQYPNIQGEQQNQGEGSQTNAGDGTGKTTPTPGVEKDVKEIKDANRHQIINGFEKKFGIDKLPADEQKVQRGKVESYLRTFGWSVDTLPLTALGESLDKAYVGSVGIDKAVEEGKVEALSAYRNNEKAVMGSFSGANLPTEEEGTLTAAQQKWVEKLHVDPDKAKKVLADRDQEMVREKPIEK
jgi:hypothetical protein